MRHDPSRRRRLVAVLVAGALAPVAVQLAPAAATATAAVAPVLDARHGTLTIRPSGLPAAGAAQARQLSSAKVTQDLVKDRVRATVKLRATPTTSTDARLQVEFGRVQGSQCVGDINFNTRTASGLSSGFTRSGATIKLDKAVSEAGYEDWDCAFAALTEVGDPNAVHDALIGQLTDVRARPRLTIPAVKLLNKNVTKVKLVRNVWTVLEVKVKNPSRVATTKVKVRGTGKGIRAKTVKLGKVYDDGSRLARVKVKLIRGKGTRLKLIVSGSGGAKATRTVRVVPTKPPRRPVSGRYRTKDGRVSFRIKKGRVVGFYTQQWTTCGGYPDIPTHQWVSYDFPTTKVPRNGIVDARQKHRLFTAGLQMKVAGKRVTRGYFFYSGPNRCFASSSFKARRVGK